MQIISIFQNIINIIDCLLECQRLNEKIPRLKWSDSVLNCVATLMDSALEYASQNFVNIISGKEFKRLDGVSVFIMVNVIYYTPPL